MRGIRSFFYVIGCGVFCLTLRIVNWIASIIMVFLSVIISKEVIFLLLMMSVLFGFGVKISNGNIFTAFCYLFDSSKAVENPWAMLLFLSVWMVGGGVLVGVIVALFHKRICGYSRRWWFLVWNHVVVLGWDKGMMEKLRQVRKDISGKIYVITKQDIPSLRKAFESAGVKGVELYQGDYDDEDEWNNYLNVRWARKIFVAGESNEEAHDARVRLLYAQLKTVVRNPENKVLVNIHDFGLARKLREREGAVFESFYDNWAVFLWTRLMKNELPLQGVNAVQLFIIGLGAIGKAVALTMPKELPADVKIVITDNDDKDDEDKLEKEWIRYSKQFGKVQPVPKPEKWETALEKMCETIPDASVRVIVVAKKRSEKGMLLLMDILSRFTTIPRTMCIALNQEIEGYETDVETAEMEIDNKKIVLFGMKKGCPDVEH